MATPQITLGSAHPVHQLDLSLNSYQILLHLELTSSVLDDLTPWWAVLLKLVWNYKHQVSIVDADGLVH